MNQSLSSPSSLFPLLFFQESAQAGECLRKPKMENKKRKNTWARKKRSVCQKKNPQPLFFPSCFAQERRRKTGVLTTKDTFPQQEYSRGPYKSGKKNGASLARFYTRRQQSVRMTKLFFSFFLVVSFSLLEKKREREREEGGGREREGGTQGRKTWEMEGFGGVNGVL